MKIISALTEYLVLHKKIIGSSGRHEGTTIISNLIREFAYKNNFKLNSEVAVEYNGSKKGRIDFLIYDGVFFYPIEIDYYFKAKSYDKLIAYSHKEKCKPIWIRWNRKSQKDKLIADIYLIDITTKITNREKNILSLDSSFNFGIHKGEPIKKVISEKPEYVRWCLSNLHRFELSDEALDYLEQSEHLLE